ncbi:unnamed protein product [Didymodactylos carnosus]|nr:unnamed protein product [Didymodactylos carnosus]CAF3551192.1 unnamed protein product [Didymodactylos carnosus]
MRSREIPPLRPPDVDTFTNHHHFDANHEWAKKLSSTKDTTIITPQENTLQFRPVIPRRNSSTSSSRLHSNLLTTISTNTQPFNTNNHNHTDLINKRTHYDLDLDNDEGTDSAIESRSLSINTSDEGLSQEQDSNNPLKKPIRSLHSSSTRRKADKIFSDFESISTRTLTPENSNESGVYSQYSSGRELDNTYQNNSNNHNNENIDDAIIRSNRTIVKDQLFSTKPRLARSGLKNKQQLLTDLSSSKQLDYNPTFRSPPSSTNVEIVGKGYMDDRPRRLSADTDEKPLINKNRAKIIKGSVITTPLGVASHTNVGSEDTIGDDGQEIGVIGKAVYLPMRTNRADSDPSKIINYSQQQKLSKRNDSEIFSDFDSDTKENESIFGRATLECRHVGACTTKAFSKSAFVKVSSAICRCFFDFETKHAHPLYHEIDSTEYDENNDNIILKLVDLGHSLSASFRLRVQQKTQEKIEQKERRRQEREIKRRQEYFQPKSNLTNNSNQAMYDDQQQPPTSSTCTSRYSSNPDLSSITTNSDLPPTPRRMIINDSNNNVLPNVASQKLKIYKNSMARSQTFNNRRDLSTTEQRLTFNRPLSEDRVTEQLRNPEAVYREAMESIASDDWERKCSGLGLLQRLVAQYPDLITQNIHQVVLVLIQEVKNLRSQVARFAISTFSDMFKHLKRNMDLELDLTVKALLQKNGETVDFFRSDTEKCLQTMIDNVTTQKALQALIAGGASHRNPAVRKASAQYIYIVCEKMGPGKILSGIKDITERVLQVAAQFVSDGPPEIRWYGKKIYQMLMSYDELDNMMQRYLNPTTYKHMREVLDAIRVKGVGETPSESARNNGRRALPTDKSGSTGNLTSNQFPSIRKMNSADQAEQIRNIVKQMRSTDFRQRMEGIEQFQKLCELETDTAISSLVQIFDAFNDCLSDMNSKVTLKSLNTMHQMVPILGDSLSNVINSTLPIIAQNIASKNNEISQLASDIIDAAIEYIDSGVLLQPLCALSQTSNLRVRPEIVLKLASIVPKVCQRRQKQVEIHLLPTYWKLLALLRGQSSSTLNNANTTMTTSSAGVGNLNSSIHILTTALYTELGSVLIEKANASSAVAPKNVQLLRELCTNIDAV